MKYNIAPTDMLGIIGKQPPNKLLKSYFNLYVLFNVFLRILDNIIFPAPGS